MEHSEDVEQDISDDEVRRSWHDVVDEDGTHDTHAHTLRILLETGEFGNGHDYMYVSAHQHSVYDSQADKSVEGSESDGPIQPRSGHSRPAELEDPLPELGLNFDTGTFDTTVTDAIDVGTGGAPAFDAFYVTVSDAFAVTVSDVIDVGAGVTVSGDFDVTVSDAIDVGAGGAPAETALAYGIEHTCSLDCCDWLVPDDSHDPMCLILSSQLDEHERPRASIDLQQWRVARDPFLGPRFATQGIYFRLCFAHALPTIQ